MKPFFDFLFKIQPRPDSSLDVIYCSSLTTYAQNYSATFSPWELLHIVFIALCILIAPTLIFISSRKRKLTVKSTNSLSSRYQNLEILKTTRLVLLDVIIYSIFNVLEIISVLLLAYTTRTALCIRKSPKKRTTITPIAESDEYFQIYKKQWD
ncbi:hypothetical protein FO519_008543 [Halicephalobus sp. NKZ332]|nr:hypothetical protein FO519_008543 [Halicephalobus sp. NKZ332]